MCGFSLIRDPLPKADMQPERLALDCRGGGIATDGEAMNWPPQPLPQISKAQWRQKATDLRMRLLQLQRRLRDADFPLILVFGGVDGAGKHEMANQLTEWLDPRFIQTLAYPHPQELPPWDVPMLRYWRDMPPKGQIGIVLSGWYTAPLLSHVRAEIDENDFAAQLRQALHFEQDLVADGALLLKFWMHLDADSQRQRLQELMADPMTLWQVQPRDWAHLHSYADFMHSTSLLLHESEQAGQAWQVIDGRKSRPRSLAVAEHIAQALEQRLEKAPPAPQIPAPAAAVDRLSSVEQHRLSKSSYAERIRQGQGQLFLHSQRLRALQRSLVLVFEGWDAAGKGGAIRRLLQALDARFLRVHRVAAPDAQELQQHYLWRFARHFPEPGRIVIFDRSWYGRMLVERVEGLTPEYRWRAAPAEINRFEEQWTDAGHMLLKFWLHITPEEQLARFEARRDDPLKSWKLTDEDWRNRDRWAEYLLAANEMFASTDSPHAPWVLVGANDKRQARVSVLEAVNTALSAC